MSRFGGYVYAIRGRIALGAPRNPGGRGGGAANCGQSGYGERLEQVRALGHNLEFAQLNARFFLASLALDRARAPVWSALFDAG